MYEILAALGLSFIIGAVSMWGVNRARRRKQERLRQEFRENASNERDRQLQEAKAKGHFDKWEQDCS